jgi:hypothetical protein
VRVELALVGRQHNARGGGAVPPSNRKEKLSPYFGRTHISEEPLSRRRMPPRPGQHGGGVKGPWGCSRPRARLCAEKTNTQRRRRRPSCNNARCRRGTKTERAATVLLPNWAAEHDTRRHRMDGQNEITKRNRVVLNGSRQADTGATEFRVRCIQPLCHLSATSRPALEGHACM